MVVLLGVFRVVTDRVDTGVVALGDARQEVAYGREPPLIPYFGEVVEEAIVAAALMVIEVTVTRSIWQDVDPTVAVACEGVEGHRLNARQGLSLRSHCLILRDCFVEREPAMAGDEVNVRGRSVTPLVQVPQFGRQRNTGLHLQGGDLLRC